MGVSCKVGAFTAPVATTDITCGFQPKAIIFWWTGAGAAGSDTCVFGDLRGGVGFGSRTQQMCVTAIDDNGAGSQTCGAGLRNDGVISSLAFAGGFDGLLTLDTFANWPSDGFRLVNTDNLSHGTRVGFIAYGGSDITDVSIDAFQEHTTTGNYDRTISGAFQPDMIFFLSPFNQSAGTVTSTVNTYMQLGLGFARTVSEQGILLVGADQGSASSDTAEYCRIGECTGGMDTANPLSITCRSTFVQMNSNGFRLNSLEQGTASAYRLAMSIKGGVWKCGALTTDNTSTPVSISSLGGTPRGVLLMSAAQGTANTQDTGASIARFYVGAATSTTERHAEAYLSYSGSGNMRVLEAVEHDQVLVTISFPTSGDGADGAAGTIQDTVDVQSVDSDGFTFITESGSGSRYVMYVMVGEAAAAGPKTAPGFMNFAHRPSLRTQTRRRVA